MGEGKPKNTTSRVSKSGGLVLKATPSIYAIKHRKHWLGGFRTQGETEVGERDQKLGTNTEEIIRQSKKFKFLNNF